VSNQIQDTSKGKRTIPLLTTKLYIPPTRPEIVPRPRLIEHLQAGLRRKLTLVSAPAGFGKTTLLSECARLCSQKVAWLSLDKSDNDPTRFWAYVVAALQTTHQNLGEATMAMLHSTAMTPASAALPMESLLTGLINEVAQVQGPLVLVLDDLHLIVSKEIHDGLYFLLDNLPPQVHLAVSSRADPPWPLARLRGQGNMIEVRVQDLRFTPDEAAAFLNDVMELDLSAKDIAALEEHTEGWIAGLQMAALSMQGRKREQTKTDLSAFIRAFTGSHRFILDYLLEEVLIQQSDDLQAFLLNTSILERLTAPLCDVVSGRTDSRAILSHLDQANLFLIALDDERRWYRYHHLFADLLYSRLRQAQPDQIPALHHTASRWYEGQKMIAEAVRHALAAGDVERVAQLIEKNALGMIYQRELTTLIGWLDALPEEMVRSRPWLCIARAWALSLVGQFEAVETLLQDAEKALMAETAAGSPPGQAGAIPGTADASLLALSQIEEAGARRAAGYILALRAYSLAVQAHVREAAGLVRASLKCLPARDHMVRSFSTSLLASVLRWTGDFAGAHEAWTESLAICQAAGDITGVVIVLCALAALQIEQGQLHGALGTGQQALQLVTEYAKEGGRDLPVAGPAYARMSTVLCEWNDLPGALEHATEAVRISERWGAAEGTTTGFTTLGRVLQAMGDYEGASRALQQARQLANSLSPWYGGQVAAQQARLRLAEGDLAAASDWAAQLREEHDIEGDFDFLSYDEYVNLARVLIAQSRETGGDHGESARLLDESRGLSARLLELAESAGATFRVIETLVVQAMAWQAGGDADRALACLERGLYLARPEGYVRSFVDEGAPMGRLLRQVVAQGIAPEYAARLLAALAEETDAETGEDEVAPQPAVDPASILVEPLTDREMDVLRLLNTTLTSAEIADQLFISVHTARSHIKNIYGKLGVHKRMDAVLQAKQLRLI
jgi:LuxR family maltose regulon positive regulatory protein